MEVVGEAGGIDKHVCKGFLEGDKHVRTAGWAWDTLAREQIRHNQQQQQAGPCLNKNMSHSEMI